MGRGVFVLNAADGSLIKLLQPPANDYVGFSNSTRRYTIPSDVTLLDTDGDGCIDRVYAGDTGAKMHRFDIGDADSANWKAYTIAALGDVGNNGGSNDRKFLYPPEVVLTVISGSQVAYVMDGTGDREQPSTTAIADRFYMIKDTLAVGAPVATSAATTHAVTEAQLTPISNFNAATTTIDATASSFKGWYIAYDPGEKSVNAPLTVAGTTFFGTNMPKAVDPKSCEANLGIARGYALNFLTGTSAFGDRNLNGNINKSDMYATFKGGGLPPSPVSGVVQISDEKTVRFIIGGGGTGATGSVIEGTKLQVNPSGVRTRVFWYFKKDE
jgi:type IV pilus assembly protein PilY1